ncbi:sigma-70 family RNA polymerase sigma factor [bacterium]|nr:sigma-70 family RNA polymerase sigma factor [bacterium]
MGGRNRYHGIDAYAVKLVHMKSKQLCRQPGFSPNDRLDIEQELMIELAERLPTHDSARATREAFITWVVLQKIADLIRSQRAKKRRINVEAISLNDLVFISEPGSLEERWATLDNEIFQQFTGSNFRSTEERIDLDIDLERVMKNLPKELYHLCELLAKYSIADVARKLGIARSSLYRSIHELRDAFDKAGLRDYL